MRKARSVSPSHPAPTGNTSGSVGRPNEPANGHQTRGVGQPQRVPANDTEPSTSGGGSMGPAPDAYGDVVG